MANITDTDGFVDVTRPEANDLALGGQEVNFPGFHFRQLASRDRFLFNQIAGDPVALNSFNNFKQNGIAAIAQGRLTLQSGNAVPSTDQFNRSTLYYTPYDGDFIALWNAAESRWDLRQFTEVSLLLSGVISFNYDIFAFWNGTEVEIEEVVWNTDDARNPSSQITQKNGVWVKAADNRRYLGTIRTTAPGRTEDSRQNRFVWNAGNRVPRIMLVQMLGVGQYTYTSATWRAAFNTNAYRLRLVCGLSSAIAVSAGQNAAPVNTANEAVAAVTGQGLNRTNGNDAQITGNRAGTRDQTFISSFGVYTLEPAYHFIQIVEASGTANDAFVGEGAGNSGISGITALWEC